MKSDLKQLQEGEDIALEKQSLECLQVRRYGYQGLNHRQLEGVGTAWEEAYCGRRPPGPTPWLTRQSSIHNNRHEDPPTSFMRSNPASPDSMHELHPDAHLSYTGTLHSTGLDQVSWKPSPLQRDLFEPRGSHCFMNQDPDTDSIVPVSKNSGSTKDSDSTEKAERRHNRSLGHYRSADRNALLSVIQHLEAQQHSKGILRSGRGDLKKQEHELCQQVRFLSNRVQQEQTVTDNLLNSLRAEQRRVRQYRASLTRERATVRALKQGLSRATLEQAPHTESTDLRKRCSSLKKQPSGVEEELVQSSDLGRVESKPSCERCKERDLDRLWEAQRLPEFKRARSSELSNTVSHQRQLFKDFIREVKEEIVSHHQTIVATHQAFILELQADLKKERSSMVELVARVDGAEQKALLFRQQLKTEVQLSREEARRERKASAQQLKTEVQLSREEARRERKASAQVCAALETLRGQAQELTRALERERRQGARLREEVEQLQDKPPNTKEKVREDQEKQGRPDLHELEESEHSSDGQSEKPLPPDQGMLGAEALRSSEESLEHRQLKEPLPPGKDREGSAPACAWENILTNQQALIVKLQAELRKERGRLEELMVKTADPGCSLQGVGRQTTE
ncbi:UNVERIFIED_CONTAM: hypothetical protein FKN15_068861 [Acipenser sinensis]